MSNVYNFDEAASSDAPLILMGGYEYRLRYPTLEEIETMQKAKSDEEKNDLIYKFVEKTKDDQPEFKEVFRKQNIKVLQKFTEMVTKEFDLKVE